MKHKNFVHTFDKFSDNSTKLLSLLKKHAGIMGNFNHEHENNIKSITCQGLLRSNETHTTYLVLSRLSIKKQAYSSRQYCICRYKNAVRSTYVGYKAHTTYVGYKAHTTYVGYKAQTTYVGYKAHTTYVGYKAHTTYVGYKAQTTYVGYKAHTTYVGYKAQTTYVGYKAQTTLCVGGSKSSSKGSRS